MDNVLVSVIIPCYNLKKDVAYGTEETTFEACMNSVLNQTLGLGNMEIILVDDASCDDGYTKGLLSNYETQFPENILTVFLDENQRQGGARNVGLSYASGEYVAFLDADDWVDIHLYEKAYKEAVREDADMVYFFHAAAKGELLVPMDDMSTPAGTYMVSNVATRKHFLMSQLVDYRCTTKLYRRSMLVETGVAFPVHMIYEEPLFTYPLMYYGTRYVVMPEVMYYYRMNPNSTMNTNHSFSSLKCHPTVQLQLFTELVERGLYEDYKDEIDYHFLHSYFYETLLFAGYQKVQIDVAYFIQMQNTILTLLPDWKENPYIRRDANGVLATVLKKGIQRVYSDRELYELCQWVSKR